MPPVVAWLAGHSSGVPFVSGDAGTSGQTHSSGPVGPAGSAGSTVGSFGLSDLGAGLDRSGPVPGAFSSVKK